MNEILGQGQIDKCGLGDKSESIPILNENHGDTIRDGSQSGSAKHMVTSKRKSRTYICHYYYSPGNIRPFCNKYRDDLTSEKMLNGMIPNIESDTTTSQKESFNRKQLYKHETCLTC